MLPTIVGPPLKGVADFKALENPVTENSREEKKAGSDSFGETLGARMAPKTKEVDDKKSDLKDQRRPESDRKLEKLKATKEGGPEKKAKGNSQRENAIRNFMDSFESEFGVPPTRIVEAMANLKATEQTQSPEATADEVIGQLGLDEQQEDQAKAMYLGLLSQLTQLSQNTQQIRPPSVPEGTGEKMFSGATGVAALMQERHSVSQEKREALNQSLDSMNQKFWMNRPETDLADRLAQISIQEKLLQPQGLKLDESILNPQAPISPELIGELKNPIPGSEEGIEASEATPEEALAALVAAARAAKSRGGVKDLASQFAEGVSEDGAPRAESETPGESLNGPTPFQAEEYETDFQSGQNFQQPKDEFGQAKESLAKSEIRAKTKDVESSDFKQALGLEGMSSSVVPTLKQEALAGVSATAGAAASQMNTASPADNETNIRQLMNQAQYLIKKGGGEMKVEMTPEGLGRIHMKVLVQDGKVNLQMAADTQEAKKTLESGLSDLKNNLAAHKLSMDHVKIDIVSGPNTENNTQNQMNQNQSGARDQARQFWSNFNQNFGHPGQERSGYTDVPNLRGYPKPRADKEIEPLQSAGVKKYAAANKGKGLDLVA